MTKEQIKIIMAKAEKNYKSAYSPKLCYVIHVKNATFKVQGSLIQDMFFGAQMIIFSHDNETLFIPFEHIQYMELHDCKDWWTNVYEQKNA